MKLKSVKNNNPSVNYYKKNNKHNIYNKCKKNYSKKKKQKKNGYLLIKINKYFMYLLILIISIIITNCFYLNLKQFSKKNFYKKYLHNILHIDEHNNNLCNFDYDCCDNC